MIQIKSIAPVPGCWPDTALLRVDLIEDRVFTAAESGIIPDDVAGDLVEKLPPGEVITAGDVEDLLEGLCDVLVDAGCAALGDIFMAVLPELYGEPPRPRKRSDAFPGSHARLECLTRRVHARSLLDHPADAQTPKIRPQVPLAPQGRPMLRLDTFHLGVSTAWHDSQGPDAAWMAGASLPPEWQRRVKNGI